MFVEKPFNDVFEMRLMIHASTYLNNEQHAKLKLMIETIAPNGETRFLSRRDTFFFYDKEREMWYGSYKGWLPFITVDELVKYKTT